MDQIYENYKKKYSKITNEWKLNNLSWNITNDELILYNNNLPFGKFKIKIIGEIINNKLIWAWDNKHNYININLYPKGLKNKIKNFIGTNIFLNTIIALDILNGIWYIHLHDENIEKIAIFTKIIKLYK